jgi:purine-binding chemotaxis protein CheW
MDKHTTDNAPAATRQYLTCYVGDALYALPVDIAREVITFTHLTDVPLMPEFVRGVINLRGAVIPVIDLSIRLGRHPIEEKKRTCIVIVDVPHERQPFIAGVLVDAISDVVNVTDNHIEVTPSFGTHIRTEYIQAMLNVNGRFIVALNIDNILSVDDIIDLAGILPAPDGTTDAKE